MELERLAQTLRDINRFGYTDQGINRLAYTESERGAVEYFIGLCRQEGLQVRTDSCGNMIARREGLNPTAPAVAFGSHLDTVILGGEYDGALGVAAALEVIRSLNEQNVETEHPIELIVFACEESSRFGVSTIGSKAIAGLLKKERLVELMDADGQTFAEAIAGCGLDVEGIERSARTGEEFKVFFELHIEQGPVLEAEHKQIGIVTGIAAPSRFQIAIQGHAAHSGTTPMNSRQDAFLGAAEIALELEQSARGEAVHGTVATVGVCDVKPGAMNVVPDFAEIKLDIRGTSVESKQRVIEKLYSSVERVERERHCRIRVNKLSDETPVHLSTEVIASLSESCKRQGLSYMLMPSGAGHDAMNMAQICPTGLIFVPSKNGVSHHHDEFTSLEQIRVGAALLEEEIMKWAVVRTREEYVKSGGESMTVRNLRVLSNTQVSERYWHMVVDSSSMEEDVSPGQFFNIKCGETLDPFLRRPFSIYRINRNERTLEFLYLVKGSGTQRMTRIFPGEALDILGPLGRGFTLAEGPDAILLLARGVGIATLTALAQEASQKGVKSIAILSARSKDDLLATEALQSLGAEVYHVTEEEGNSGVERVQELIRQIMRTNSIMAAYTCGSKRLSKMLQTLMRERGIPGQIALEEHMGCAMGVCYACVCDIRENHGVHSVRVCLEGPVFDLQKAVLV